MDLKNLILAKKLFTPAKVMTYGQDHGDAQCRKFIGKNQKKIKEWIDEAKEWRDARGDEGFSQSQVTAFLQHLQTRCQSICHCECGVHLSSIIVCSLCRHILPPRL